MFDSWPQAVDIYCLSQRRRGNEAPKSFRPQPRQDCAGCLSANRKIRLAESNTVTDLTTLVIIGMLSFAGIVIWAEQGALFKFCVGSIQALIESRITGNLIPDAKR